MKSADTKPAVSEGPYRTPPDGPRALARRSNEFVYAPRNDERRRDGLLVVYWLLSVPLLLMKLGGWLAGSIGAILGLVGGATGAVWRWRARTRRGGAVLSVEGGVLSVAIRGRRLTRESLRLRDLATVTLDLEAVERIADGPSAIPAVRLLSPALQPKLDVARIVLVDLKGREVRLTEEYASHSDATLWMGKIRLFLRGQGWVPEDERE